ncbi:MAG: hypothetical protein CI948_2617, partial [Halanaerobium sp.]
AADRSKVKEKSIKFYKPSFLFLNLNDKIKVNISSERGNELWSSYLH